ncbi:MAG: tetratricopeptide repeat protein [Myxococcales bacterium]|nr:MAG: tetratricopeptide repeat protein [Myxococcales bacterium]
MTSDDDTAARRVGSRLAGALSDAHEDPAATRRLRERVLASPPSAITLRPARVLLAAAMLLCAGAAGWFASRSSLSATPVSAPLQVSANQPGPVERSAFIYSTAARPLELNFSDSTRFSVAAGSGVRILALDDAGAQVALEFGKLHASVRHRPGARWRVTAGPFSVHVIGTELDVQWEPTQQRIVVRVQHGRVRVEGSGMEPQTVDGGGTLSAQGFAPPLVEVSRAQASTAPVKAPQVSASDSPPAALEPAPAPPPVSGVASPSTATPKSSASGATARAPASNDVPAELAAPAHGSAPTWRALATAGRFRQALDAALAEGVWDELPRATAADLLLLGNTARLAGEWPRAVQAFTALRETFPQAAGSGRAAFWLGTIAFDRKGDWDEARRWFSTYLREEPTGELAREARGRLLEIMSKRGEHVAARAAAVDYLERYPRGPHAELARSMTAR